jgi:hypothetical protein
MQFTGECLSVSVVIGLVYPSQMFGFNYKILAELVMPGLVRGIHVFAT